MSFFKKLWTESGINTDGALCHSSHDSCDDGEFDNLGDSLDEEELSLDREEESGDNEELRSEEEEGSDDILSQEEEGEGHVGDDEEEIKSVCPVRPQSTRRPPKYLADYQME